MDSINIYFFALASIIGLETTSIVSQQASVTINHLEKTFEIHQKDLFSIIVTAQDSLTLVNELQEIMEFHKNMEKKTADGLTIDEIILNAENKQVNAVLKGRYTDPKVLEEAGIHLDSTANGEFSMINIPDWNIRSSEAVLKGNYWGWPADKSVTIIMEPYNNIPGEYLKHRRSILQYWEKWLEHKPER